MTRFIPLIFLGLAACDAPLEEFWPRERHSFEQLDRVYDVYAQYDPLEKGWFSRVSLRNGRLESQDRASAIEVVEQMLGPKVCEGRPLTVYPEQIWTGYGANRIRYLPDNGEWQLVGDCVDAPEAPESYGRNIFEDIDNLVKTLN